MKTLILAATAAALLASGAAHAQPRAARGDANGDGALSLTEFKAVQGERMMRLDGDGDGKVSKAEWSVMPRGQGGAGGDPARAFGLLDRNHDGGLDRGEIDAVLARRFARLDADKDGTVTAAERAAQVQGRRAAKP